MNTLRTASAYNGQCLVCRRSKIKLRTVKLHSINTAYTKHKIIIKRNSRVCSRHLDTNGLIRQEEYHHIRTSVKTVSKQTINELNSTIGKSLGVFEKFIDLDSLEEDHCYQITGFTKAQFSRFSKYITTVYETAGRTKNELIAIYRFWLRKGVDQTSIALYRDNTPGKTLSQRQRLISDYLQQIRVAINNEFVPFFLGATKSREFFVGHNNITTKILHDLKDDDLAVVVDATYTRLEKSSYNSFQYSSWSQQKKDLLIKPFLVCCTDGYIIDCYGPFEAHLNDAKIFDYILRTDQNLNRILEPNKTLVLVDRGK